MNNSKCIDCKFWDKFPFDKHADGFKWSYCRFYDRYNAEEKMRMPDGGSLNVREDFFCAEFVEEK